MSLLHTIVAFVVALGVLIVVHEFGHYLAARLSGVKVLRFSVGFGRPLAMVRRGADRTEWVIAAIPFGGYVRMLDEREGAVPEREAHRAFNRQGVGRRFFIVAAGPAFNFLFAILVYAGLYMYGLPEARPILGAPPAGSLAADAGVRPGDTVRAVAGEEVVTWQEVRWRILQAALQQERIQLETAGEGGRSKSIDLDFAGFASDEVETDVLERAGLRLYRPPMPPVLGTVVSGSPAAKAGLAEGDRILRANGTPVATWEELVMLVRSSPGSTLRLSVERGETTLAIDVVPESIKSGDALIGRIGAAPRVPAIDRESMLVRVQHGPLDSVAKAIAKTWDISIFSLKMLGRMLVGAVSWKHLSGPVTIADFAGQSAQMGLISYLTFLALISISLGVLNLLPIPLLDGGHLMYYAIELIKGRPVSERAMELGQRVGLALLLVMMAFAFYNDFNRLLTG